MQMSDPGKSAYVAGAYDAGREKFPWMENCTPDWSAGQLRAVFEKYLKEHPEDWAYTASSLLPRAVANVCPSAPAAFKN